MNDANLPSMTREEKEKYAPSKLPLLEIELNCSSGLYTINETNLLGISGFLTREQISEILSFLNNPNKPAFVSPSLLQDIFSIENTNSIEFGKIERGRKGTITHREQFEFVRQFLINLRNPDEVERRNWVLILAQMQSGKTEIYANILQVFLHHMRYKHLVNTSEMNPVAYVNYWRAYFYRLIYGIDTTCFVLTIDQNDIVNDIKEKLVTLIGCEETELEDWRPFAEYQNDKMHIEMKNSIRALPFFLKNSTIKDYRAADLALEMSNCLFVIDEAHYGSQQDQVMDDVLELKSISSTAALKSLNNILVTVSATPFAEMTAAQATPVPNKMIMAFEPPQAYCSIRTLLERGQIEDSVSHSADEIIAQIKSAHKKFEANFPNTPHVTIFRDGSDTGKKGGKKEMTRAVASYFRDKCGFRHCEYNSSVAGASKKVAQLNRDMKSITENSFFVIKGALRAGVTLANIGSVSCLYEMPVKGTAKGRNATILQSLAGRGCGYGNREMQIFSEKKYAELYQGFWNLVIEHRDKETNILQFDKLPIINGANQTYTVKLTHVSFGGEISPETYSKFKDLERNISSSKPAERDWKTILRNCLDIASEDDRSGTGNADVVALAREYLSSTPGNLFDGAIQHRNEIHQESWVAIRDDLMRIPDEQTRLQKFEAYGQNGELFGKKTDYSRESLKQYLARNPSQNQSITFALKKIADGSARPRAFPARQHNKTQEETPAEFYHKYDGSVFIAFCPPTKYNDKYAYYLTYLPSQNCIPKETVLDTLTAKKLADKSKTAYRSW